MISGSRLIETAKKSNFIVLAGMNDDSIKPLINTLKETFVDKAFEDFDYIEMYGDEIDIEQLAQNILAAPMVSEKKLIVIRNGVELSPTQCRDIDSIMDDAADRVLMVIIYTDSSKYHRQIVSRAKELFSNAQIAQLREKREMGKDDVMARAREASVDISESTAGRIEHISQGNPDIVNNLVKTAWMMNDSQSFESILAENSGFDISPVMHNEFLMQFSMSNAKKCFNIYRQLIKWHVMSPDGLIVILLNRLQQMRYPGKNRYPIKMNANKWKNSEIDKAYLLFYNVLRNFRTLRKEYATLLFEQTLLNILNS